MKQLRSHHVSARVSRVRTSQVHGGCRRLEGQRGGMHASRRWTRRARRMLQLRGAAGALAGTPLERALRKGKRRTDKMHSVKDEIAGWEMVAGQEKFFSFKHAGHKLPTQVGEKCAVRSTGD